MWFGDNDNTVLDIAYQPDNNIGRLFVFMSRYARFYIKKSLGWNTVALSEDFTALAKPGATVSMPLCWGEVKSGLTMRHFTIHNAIGRLRETGDLFKGGLGKGIDLEATIERAQSVFQTPMSSCPM